MSEAGRALLFSYGTLQNEDVQLALFGRGVATMPDVLIGFTLEPITFEDDQGNTVTHGIVAYSGDAADRVEGAVLSLSAEEIAAADVYEPSDYYERISTILASGKRAWVYAKP